jgi:DNA-binding Xre family transcriptional regulator
MKDRGHDTVTLAAATGLSKQVIGFLASGYRKSCSRETAERISAALGCLEGDLFSLPVSAESEEGSQK